MWTCLKTHNWLVSLTVNFEAINNEMTKSSVRKGCIQVVAEPCSWSELGSLSKSQRGNEWYDDFLFALFCQRAHNRSEARDLISWAGYSHHRYLTAVQNSPTPKVGSDLTVHGRFTLWTCQGNIVQQSRRRGWIGFTFISCWFFPICLFPEEF